MRKWLDADSLKAAWAGCSREITEHDEKIKNQTKKHGAVYEAIKEHKDTWQVNQSAEHTM